MTDDDYRKDIPILSDSKANANTKANNPPPKTKTYVFVCYADTDIDVQSVRDIVETVIPRLKSRHENNIFVGDGCYSEPHYQCIICYSSDMYVNYKANRISCNSCGKIWTVKEWTKDLDHLILESNPEAKDLIDEINQVTNK